MSPVVSIDRDELKQIVAFLIQYLDIEHLKDEIKPLKHIDWWIFNKDADQFETPKQEWLENVRLIKGAALAIAHTVEHMLLAGRELSSPEKHEIVVATLDKLIRAPWYLEPFDGIVIDMIITFTVDVWNAIGWDTPALPAAESKNVAMAVGADVVKLDRGRKIDTIWNEVGGLSKVAA